MGHPYQPEGAPPPQPAYWVGPQAVYYPPPRRPRAPIYLAVAVAAVVVTTLAIAIPAMVQGSGERPPSATVGDLILAEDDFAGYGGEFTDSRGTGTDAPVEADPPECSVVGVVQRPEGADYAMVMWHGSDGIRPAAYVMVENWADTLLAERAQLIDDSCGSFSYEFTDDTNELGPTDVEAEVFDVEGADASAVGTELVYGTGGLTEITMRRYEAVVRGTTIRVVFVPEEAWSDADERDAVGLLNLQITRIRDAP